jgi:hypothetical protein
MFACPGFKEVRLIWPVVQYFHHGVAINVFCLSQLQQLQDVAEA